MGDVEDPDVMAAAQAYGIDDRAQQLLHTLDKAKQQIAIEKLAAGVEAGKVRNASAYIVGVCNGPDLLGIDEKAMKALKELPPDAQKTILENLRKTADVRNPSAWVVNSVMTMKKNGMVSMPSSMMMMPAPMASSWAAQPSWGHAMPMQQGGARAAAHMAQGVLNSLDPGARALLQTLPREVQGEILSRLQQQNAIKNPSAWVVKAAVEAGADTNNAAGPVSSRGPSAGAWQQQQQPVMRAAPYPAAQPTCMVALLDSRAQELLYSLPAHTQQELIGKLESQAMSVKNPSAWMAKAALQSGAQPAPRGPPESNLSTHTNMGGMGGGADGQFSVGQQLGASELQLDARAQELLSTISPEAQQEIMQKLRNTPDVKNPSAWVAKAALKSGATATPNTGQAQQGAGEAATWGPMGTWQAGGMRPGPYMR